MSGAAEDTLHQAIRTTLVLLAACTGDQGPPGPAGPPGGLDPDLPALDKAYAGVGGRDALAGLTSFRIEASGERLMTLEGYHPEDDAATISTFSSATSTDVAGSRLRIDYQRAIPLFGAMKQYSVIVDGTRAATDGIESVFGAPGGPLPADRWAATLRHQRLLNPQLLLRDVANGARTATDAGLALRDGQLRHRIEITDPVHPISLFVDRYTGELTELETTENEWISGDATVEVHYLGWRAYGDVRFPSDVVIAVNDQPVHAEHRDSVDENPALPDSAFALPAGTYTPDDAAAARGARNGQFHEMFAGLGVPLDGLQTDVQPQQLATGVWHLRGGSHNSLVVEQAAGVVVVEAPLYEPRAKALYAWIAANIGKPVTHVVVTHHHRDHAGSLRTFVARGARVVIGESARPFYTRAFGTARTLEPDELAAAPRAAAFDPVAPGATFVIPDATRPVRVVAIASTHAADMVVAYVPSAKALFVSDIYSPGLPPNPYGAAELKAAIAAANLDVATIAGGHGIAGPKSDLDAVPSPFAPSVGPRTDAHVDDLAGVELPPDSAFSRAIAREPLWTFHAIDD